VILVVARLLLAVGPALGAGDSETKQPPAKTQGSVQPAKSLNVNVVESDHATVSQSEHSLKVTPPETPPNEGQPVKKSGNEDKFVSAPRPQPQPPQPQPPSEANRGRGGRNDWSPGWNDHPRGGRHDRGSRGWNDPWRPWSSRRHWDFWMGPVFVPFPVFVSEPASTYRYSQGVYVRFSGDDELGSNVAQSLRESLREQGLKSVYSEDEARLEMYIVSMDEDATHPGSLSAVSVTYIWMPGNRFITTQVLDVPSSDVTDVGAYLAGHALEMINEYK
jgi:hypothetical protein